MRLGSTLGWGRSSRPVPRFFTGAFFALLLRSDGYPRKHRLCPPISAATGRTRTRLPKSGSASLAVCGRRAGQDLSDPTPPGGTIVAVGWTGFWWRGLLPCLPGFAHIQCLLPGTGGPYRSSVCWSVCGAVMGKDAVMEQGSGINAGIYCRASSRFTFNYCHIRAKERYSRKGRNSVRGGNAISKRRRKCSEALLSIFKSLCDCGIWLLP